MSTQRQVPISLRTGVPERDAGVLIKSVSTFRTHLCKHIRKQLLGSDPPDISLRCALGCPLEHGDGFLKPEVVISYRPQAQPGRSKGPDLKRRTCQALRLVIVSASEGKVGEFDKHFSTIG